MRSKIWTASSILLTVIYFIVRSIVRISEVIKIPYSIGIPLLLFGKLLFIVVILCWYNNIKNLLMKYVDSKDEYGDKLIKSKVYKKIFVLCLAGIVTFVMGMGVVNYIVWYWEYLDELIVCLVLRVILVIGWLLFLVWYARNVEYIICSGNKKTKRVPIYICLSLIIASLMIVSYTYNKGEDVWYAELVEKYSQIYNQ